MALAILMSMLSTLPVDLYACRYEDCNQFINVVLMLTTLSREVFISLVVQGYVCSSDGV